MRKLFFDIKRKQAGENGISRILGGGRQDRIKRIFFQNTETLCKYGLDRLPLVETKIIDQHKKCRDTRLYMWQHFKLNEVMTHHRCFAAFWIDPTGIILTDKLKKLRIGLAFLR